MKRAARRSLGFLHRVVREKPHDLRDKARTGKSFFHVVAFRIDVRIDLVRDAVITLVAFETNVMRRRPNPNRSAANLKWRFPYTQVIARRHNGNWFRM